VISRALLYAVFVLVLTGVIALVVAGIIKLLYRAVHRGENKKITPATGPGPISP
jgi:hypothetical protein